MKEDIFVYSLGTNQSDPNVQRKKVYILGLKVVRVVTSVIYPSLVRPHLCQHQTDHTHWHGDSPVLPPTFYVLSVRAGMLTNIRYNLYPKLCTYIVHISLPSDIKKLREGFRGRYVWSSRVYTYWVGKHSRGRVGNGDTIGHACLQVRRKYLMFLLRDVELWHIQCESYFLSMEHHIPDLLTIDVFGFGFF